MMSTDIRLRENYANTLFDLARENDVLDAVREDLETIARVVRKERDLVRFLTSPYFSGSSKEKFIRTALSGRITELTMNFIMVLIKHNRVGLLVEIVARYGELWDVEHNCYPVEATVSRPLEKDEVERLKEDMETAFGGAVRLEWVVDPDILGGIIVRCRDKVIDNSIHNRLRTAVKTIISQVKGRK